LSDEVLLISHHNVSKSAPLTEIRRKKVVLTSTSCLADISTSGVALLDEAKEKRLLKDDVVE